MKQIDELNRYQERICKLDERRFLRQLHLQKMRKILGWTMLALLSAGIIVMVPVIWFCKPEMWDYRLALLFLLFPVCLIASIGMLLKERKKPGGRRQSLFEKYGSPDALLHSLQKGAGNILLETETVVLTESYIINQKNYAEYIPYQHVAVFGKKEEKLTAALLGVQEERFLLIKDDFGESFLIPVPLQKYKQQDVLDVIVVTIKLRAPHAEYLFSNPA